MGAAGARQEPRKPAFVRNRHARWYDIGNRGEDAKRLLDFALRRHETAQANRKHSHQSLQGAPESLTSQPELSNIESA